MENESNSTLRATLATSPPIPVTDIPENEVMTALERVLGSARFSHSRRLCRFLRFIVEQAMHVGPGKLKEYGLGVEVFDRGISFDPRMDPIVRVEARRLRMKLRQYYKSEGRNDHVHIGFAKGGYAPTFRKKSPRSRKRSPLPSVTLSIDTWRGDLSSAVARAVESQRPVILGSAGAGVEVEVVPLPGDSGTPRSAEVRIVRTGASAALHRTLAEQVEELRAIVQQLTALLKA